MLKNLVIVESPAKAKTIEKFLGPDYKVMSSYGHVRDLKRRSFSIDVDHGFKPIYEIPDDKQQLVAELRKAAAEAETVWLASDEDREGEAISWHLYEVLGLKPENTRRIVFHEITKRAILNAIANPRDIDINLVDAQQARRVLDRIVGFELSPVLWKKVKPALSAGRVQSVALRLIVERENEIKNFVSEEYWRVAGTFATADGTTFNAELNRRLPDEAASNELLRECAGNVFTVGEVSVKPHSKAPAPPFTTSTLQQEASRRLGFTVSQTMMVAQHLYEAGHITYMRTDSVNLSQEALTALSSEITEKYGEKYLKMRQYQTSSKGAQEAHEAIRPTYIDRPTIEGTAQEKRLYALIWRRTMATQMADAQIEKTTVEINSPALGADHFSASGEVVKFDGFLRVYSTDGSHADAGDEHDATDAEGTLPALTGGQKLAVRNITATERFTQQPARYTEATLVRKMEELGIGRPSTYAPTISTIQQREYVEKGQKEGTEREFDVLVLDADGHIERRRGSESVGSDKGKLVPTDIGCVVNEFLTQYFPEILDYNFTANVEERFDDIAEGKLAWNSEIGRFYDDFHPKVISTQNMRLEHKVGERFLGNDPATGEPVSVKIGRYGPLVQVGETDGNLRFASLLKGQSMQTITLEEALRLFDFPRDLGTFEDADVTVAIGRFGPYVRHNNKFVSIPKDEAPASVTLERAIELITAKREADSKKVVKTFEDDADTQILNGRFGVYIASGGSNYKIPKTVADPSALTLEEVQAIIAGQSDKPKRKKTKK
ncbi:MAG: type I DNA topoisomerase [Muribaculaceae bacterium]|nr:type I DNA topoisomerase [Muribaculaceae bacterium]